MIAVPLLLLAFSGACSPLHDAHTWNVRELAKQSSPTVSLLDNRGTVVATFDTRVIKQIMRAHFKMTQLAGVRAELFLIDGDVPNAHIGHIRQPEFSSHGGIPVIALNISMLKLLDSDIDAFAAVIGHEAAHLARNHGVARRLQQPAIFRESNFRKLAAGPGGVPVVLFGQPAAAYLIDNRFSHSEEREADELSLDYMTEAGYDPLGAIRLQKTLLDDSHMTYAPNKLASFLSTHPITTERIKDMIDTATEKGYEVPQTYLDSIAPLDFQAVGAD